jgi:hypothetical protein
MGLAAGAGKAVVGLMQRPNHDKAPKKNNTPTAAC